MKPCFQWGVDREGNPWCQLEDNHDGDCSSGHPRTRETLADHLCQNWGRIAGSHIHTEGGCPMHLAIADLVLEAP